MFKNNNDNDNITVGIVNTTTTLANKKKDKVIKTEYYRQNKAGERKGEIIVKTSRDILVIILIHSSFSLRIFFKTTEEKNEVARSYFAFHYSEA